jgi:hypothetical protein
MANTPWLPDSEEEPGEEHNDEQETQDSEEERPQRFCGGYMKTPKDVCSRALGQGRTGHPDTREGAVAKLRYDHDAERIEVWRDPTEPAYPPRDVDDKVPRGEKEENGEGIANERCSSEATLNTC